MAMNKLVFLAAILGLLPFSTLAQHKPRAASTPNKASAAPESSDPIRESDRLFTHGADAARDRQALAVIERAVATEGNNYQLLWRASRLYYFVGDSADKAQKLPNFERGIGMGQRSVALEPNSAEGHFWLGANYGGYSEEKGMIKALQTVKKIRAEMETVLRLNPGYEEGGAYLALGEMDRQLPGMFGGDNKRAISYLEQGVRVAPQNMEMKLALAEAYRKAGRRDDARRQLQEILQMPINPAHARDNRETQEKARQLLNK